MGFTCKCVWAKPRQSWFYDNLKHELTKYETCIYILCGKWNLVLN